MAKWAWGRAIGAVVLGAVLSVGAALPTMAQSVRVTVNGTPVTDSQIAMRVKLLQLEGNRGGQKAATDQLIDEAIQLTEAKRLNISVSNAQVEEAMLQVARNLKLSSDKLQQVLNQSGVNIDTLRDRLRASIAWNGVTQAAVAPQVQISDLQLDQQAAAQVQPFQSFDYILKEIIFVGGGNRSGQANQFRSNFTGCDSAVPLSLNYTDAAVIDVGRRHATQLPEPIAKELAGLNVGGITKPRVVETGVSMLAVCEKAQAQDLTFIKGNLEAEAGTEVLQGKAEEYLANLRKQAKIIYN